MKKIFENKPRLIFWIGFILIFALVLTGLIIQLTQISKNIGSDNEDNNIITGAAEQDPKELELAMNQIGVEGIVSSFNNNTLKIETANENLTLKTTESTVISKGATVEAGSLSDLKEGANISVTYIEEDLEILSIFIISKE